MNGKVKKGIIIGGSAIALFLSVYYIRKSIKNRRLNRPCVGKKCTNLMIGKTLNTKYDKINVRETPVVDDGLIFDNLLGVVRQNPIGVVLESVIGEDGYNWYRVKLTQPLDGRSEGYVREDVITVVK